MVERGGEGDGGWGEGSGKPARCWVHFSLSEQLWEVCITIPISQMETEACRGMLTCLTLKMTKYGFKPTKCDSKTPAMITQNQKGSGPEMVQKCSGVGRRGHGSRSSSFRETRPHHGLARHCDLSPSALATGRDWGKARVLTSRTGPAGRGHRRVSASGTWASHRQPGQTACNSRPPYSGASRAGREAAEEGYLLPFPPVASAPTGSPPWRQWRREPPSPQAADHATPTPRGGGNTPPDDNCISLIICMQPGHETSRDLSCCSNLRINDLGTEKHSEHWINFLAGFPRRGEGEVRATITRLGHQAPGRAIEPQEAWTLPSGAGCPGQKQQGRP